uniref:Proliferating cell nuclear antigen PCNA N-terminal domain-containing protein n=1 Tax=viral metagenome TaxID=1070528 RepID=A0A6C0CXN4_9ZZZZ
MNTENILEIKTIQSSAIRILVEALKEILTDTNILFDETGVKLITTDSTKSVLIHMKLDSNKFESYYCESSVVCGLCMLNLYKLIKTISNQDTLTLFISKNNKNKLGIIINNNEKKSQTKYELNLLDINEDLLKPPPVEFETEISYPASDFQKIIRDMINIGTNVDIKSVGQSLILSCEGDFASQETILKTSDDGLQYISDKSDNDLVQGEFSLKYLSLFTKCTNMCNLLKLYIKNDYPLIIQYSVASLGFIKLCLAPNIK